MKTRSHNPPDTGPQALIISAQYSLSWYDDHLSAEENLYSWPQMFGLAVGWGHSGVWSVVEWHYHLIL